MRRSYDRVAGRYADEFVDELGRKPLDRALLAVLAEDVARRDFAAFHTGREVRHLDTWWDEPVDLDFRFLEAGEVTVPLERAGFVVEAVLERASYPGEVDTRRTYILARRAAAAAA